MEKEYSIYGIRYEEWEGNRVNAVCSAESSEEAISILEKALKDKGHEEERIEKIHFSIKIKETEFKTSKKGMIFGYDFIKGFL